MPVNTYFAKMAALNLVFQTEETSGKRGNILLCEWGAAHCCTAWFNAELKVLSDLKYVSFEMLNEEAIQNVIDTLFGHSADAEKVVACSAFPQAVLTPARLYKREDAVIALFTAPGLLRSLLTLLTNGNSLMYLLCLHPLPGNWKKTAPL
jgi:hypothetical protein